MKWAKAKNEDLKVKKHELDDRKLQPDQNL